MQLALLGVRGSTAAPGADFVRYGGHTSCVAVTADGDDVPTLVLDAGTGLRGLTAQLAGAPYRGAILVSHLHWDHVQGLPFFVAGDRDDAQVDLYLPEQEGGSGRDLLARQMSPPNFPIEPEGLRGEWRFLDLPVGTRSIGAFSVRSAEVCHKGGRTFGYRVTDASGRRVAYLPDHAPALGCPTEVKELVAGADVMLHDAQFVESERRIADLFGHATVGDAIALAVETGVRHLVLFHHGPARTDESLDLILDGIDAPLPVTVARQGDVLMLDRAPAVSPRP